MFQTFNDTLYVKFIKHTFFQHHSKWNTKYSQKKQVMLHNTFNIHGNATLPLLITKYMFFLFEEAFQII